MKKSEIQQFKLQDANRVEDLKTVVRSKYFTTEQAADFYLHDPATKEILRQFCPKQFALVDSIYQTLGQEFDLEVNLPQSHIKARTSHHTLGMSF